MTGSAADSHSASIHKIAIRLCVVLSLLVSKLLFSKTNLGKSKTSRAGSKGAVSCCCTAHIDFYSDDHETRPWMWNSKFSPPQ